MAEQASYRTDIGKGRLGAIYGKAYLAVAEQAGQPEALVQELDDLVVEVIQTNPQFDLTLASPRLSVEEKTALIDRTLGGRISDTLLRFLKVICQHGRMDCLREIRQAAVEQFQESRGRVAVTVTSATPLEEQLQQRIREVLGEKLGLGIDLHVNVDPEILGGLIVRVGDTVFDGSVVNRLRLLRTEAVERTLEQLRQSSDQLASELSL